MPVSKAWEQREPEGASQSDTIIIAMHVVVFLSIIEMSHSYVPRR